MIDTEDLKRLQILGFPQDRLAVFNARRDPRLRLWTVKLPTEDIEAAVQESNDGRLKSLLDYLKTQLGERPYLSRVLCMAGENDTVIFRKRRSYRQEDLVPIRR